MGESDAWQKQSFAVAAQRGDAVMWLVGLAGGLAPKGRYPNRQLG